MLCLSSSVCGRRLARLVMDASRFCTISSQDSTLCSEYSSIGLLHLLRTRDEGVQSLDRLEPGLEGHRSIKNSR